MQDENIDQGQPLSEDTDEPIEAPASDTVADTVTSDKTDDASDELLQAQSQLEALMAEKKKDELHAARKITEQGQGLRSRDVEIANLRREVEALRRQSVDLYSEDDDILRPETPSWITEQFTLTHDGMLELMARQARIEEGLSRQSSSKKIQDKFGLTPEQTEAYLSAMDNGEPDRAGEILVTAQRISRIKADRQLASRRQRGAQASVGVSGSPPSASKKALADQIRGLSTDEQIDLILKNL